MPASATDAAIQNKIFELSMTALVISNEEIYGIMKIIKSLEESVLMLKSIGEIIKNEPKGQKCGLLGIF